MLHKQKKALYLNYFFIVVLSIPSPHHHPSSSFPFQSTKFYNNGGNKTSYDTHTKRQKNLPCFGLRSLIMHKT